MSKLIHDDLVNLIKTTYTALNPTDIRIGRIISISPFQVEVDKQVEYYPDGILILPEYLTKWTMDAWYEGELISDVEVDVNVDVEVDVNVDVDVNVSTDTGSGSGSGKGTGTGIGTGVGTGTGTAICREWYGKLTVDNSLKVGDTIIMLKCLKGTKYLILDRVGKKGAA